MPNLLLWREDASRAPSRPA